MDRNKISLENQKHTLIMKKKIAELEEQMKAADEHAKAVTDQLVEALRENAQLVRNSIFCNNFIAERHTPKQWPWASNIYGKTFPSFYSHAKCPSSWNFGH